MSSTKFRDGYLRLCSMSLKAQSLGNMTLEIQRVIAGNQRMPLGEPIEDISQCESAIRRQLKKRERNVVPFLYNLLSTIEVEDPLPPNHDPGQIIIAPTFGTCVNGLTGKTVTKLMEVGGFAPGSSTGGTRYNVFPDMALVTETVNNYMVERNYPKQLKPKGARVSSENYLQLHPTKNQLMDFTLGPCNPNDWFIVENGNYIRHEGARVESTKYFDTWIDEMIMRWTSLPIVGWADIEAMGSQYIFETAYWAKYDTRMVFGPVGKLSYTKPVDDWGCTPTRQSHWSWLGCRLTYSRVSPDYFGPSSFCCPVELDGCSFNNIANSTWRCMKVATKMQLRFDENSICEGLVQLPGTDITRLGTNQPSIIYTPTAMLPDSFDAGIECGPLECTKLGFEECGSVSLVRGEGNFSMMICENCRKGTITTGQFFMLEGNTNYQYPLTTTGTRSSLLNEVHDLVRSQYAPQILFNRPRPAPISVTSQDMMVSELTFTLSTGDKFTTAYSAIQVIPSGFDYQNIWYKPECQFGSNNGTMFFKTSDPNIPYCIVENEQMIDGVSDGKDLPTGLYRINNRMYNISRTGSKNEMSGATFFKDYRNPVFVITMIAVGVVLGYILLEYIVFPKIFKLTMYGWIKKTCYRRKGVPKSYYNRGMIRDLMSRDTYRPIDVESMQKNTKSFLDKVVEIPKNVQKGPSKLDAIRDMVDEDHNVIDEEIYNKMEKLPLKDKQQVARAIKDGTLWRSPKTLQLLMVLCLITMGSAYDMKVTEVNDVMGFLDSKVRFEAQKAYVYVADDDCHAYSDDKDTFTDIELSLDEGNFINICFDGGGVLTISVLTSEVIMDRSATWVTADTQTVIVDNSRCFTQTFGSCARRGSDFSCADKFADWCSDSTFARKVDPKDLVSDENYRFRVIGDNPEDAKEVVLRMSPDEWECYYGMTGFYVGELKRHRGGAKDTWFSWSMIAEAGPQVRYSPNGGNDNKDNWEIGCGPRGVMCMAVVPKTKGGIIAGKYGVSKIRYKLSFTFLSAEKSNSWEETGEFNSHETVIPLSELKGTMRMKEIISDKSVNIYYKYTASGTKVTNIDPFAISDIGPSEAGFSAMGKFGAFRFDPQDWTKRFNYDRVGMTTMQMALQPQKITKCIESISVAESTTCMDEDNPDTCTAPPLPDVPHSFEVRDELDGKMMNFFGYKPPNYLVSGNRMYDESQPIEMMSSSIDAFYTETDDDEDDEENGIQNIEGFWIRGVRVAYGVRTTAVSLPSGMSDFYSNEQIYRPVSSGNGDLWGCEPPKCSGDCDIESLSTAWTCQAKIAKSVTLTGHMDITRVPPRPVIKDFKLRECRISVIHSTDNFCQIEGEASLQGTAIIIVTDHIICARSTSVPNGRFVQNVGCQNLKITEGGTYKICMKLATEEETNESCVNVDVEFDPEGGGEGITPPIEDITIKKWIWKDLTSGGLFQMIGKIFSTGWKVMVDFGKKFTDILLGLVNFLFNGGFLAIIIGIIVLGLIFILVQLIRICKGFRSKKKSN